jgi:hypothetical protein
MMFRNTYLQLLLYIYCTVLASLNVEKTGKQIAFPIVIDADTILSTKLPFRKYKHCIIL